LNAALVADVQDHAHNDYLELATDAGLPAALALAAIVVSLLAFARRHAHRTVALASACGVTAISAAALVDFPLHRPTELFVFWVLAGIVFVNAPAVAASE
jgi:O-antigen ligase